jgi:hypothetical protein
MKAYVIRKEMNHPFKPETPIYRAYEQLADGSLFNLRMAAESEQELNERLGIEKVAL